MPRLGLSLSPQRRVKTGIMVEKKDGNVGSEGSPALGIGF